MRYFPFKIKKYRRENFLFLTHITYIFIISMINKTIKHKNKKGNFSFIFYCFQFVSIWHIFSSYPPVPVLVRWFDGWFVRSSVHHWFLYFLFTSPLPPYLAFHIYSFLFLLFSLFFSSLSLIISNIIRQFCESCQKVWKFTHNIIFQLNTIGNWWGEGKHITNKIPVREWTKHFIFILWIFFIYFNVAFISF